MDRPKVSVIIPVRNEARKIGRCLEAVLAQSVKPHEVIVVDGHSTDNTVENAAKFPVKVLYEDYHNRAGGCQVGIDNAEGEYIAFTDADCIPDREWLESLLKEIDEGVVGVGGRVQDIGEGLWVRSVNLTLRTFLSGAKSRWGDYRGAVKNLGVGGANGLCLKEALQGVGGFNVTLSGAEDLDIGKKLERAGKLVYTPDALVLHNHERGLWGFARQAYHYGGWRRESRTWDWQVIPPLAFPLVCLSLIFTRWFFLGTLALYLFAVILMGMRIAIQQKNPVYVLTIPVVYAIEHFCYIIGFWKEVIRPRKKGVTTK